MRPTGLVRDDKPGRWVIGLRSCPSNGVGREHSNKTSEKQRGGPLQEDPEPANLRRKNAHGFG